MKYIFWIPKSEKHVNERERGGKRKITYHVTEFKKGAKHFGVVSCEWSSKTEHCKRRFLENNSIITDSGIQYTAQGVLKSCYNREMDWMQLKDLNVHLYKELKTSHGVHCTHRTRRTSKPLVRVLEREFITFNCIYLSQLNSEVVSVTEETNKGKKPFCTQRNG